MSDLIGSRVGAELLRFLESAEEPMLAMLEAFVTRDTQWSNPAGVNGLGDEIGSLLFELGFEIEAVPQARVRDERAWLAAVLAPEVDYESLAPTRIASRDGTGEDRVLLLGDLDTALPPLAATPFEVRNGRAFGSGVADMKAGLVMMLWALRALYELGIPTPPIDIVLSGDEQAGSLGSSMVIARVAVGAPWTLCMECARDGGRYMTSRGHIGVGRLDAKGRASHAGTRRAAGHSAIRALAELIPAIDDLTSYDEGLLATVTIVRGGIRRSVVPGEAMAIVDLRALHKGGWDTLIDRLEETVRSSDSVQLLADCHRPGVEPGPRTDHLVNLIRADSQCVGGFPGTTGSTAAGSSAFAAASGSAVLDGMGPPGGDLMTDAEYIETRGITERGALLGSLLHELTKDRPGEPIRD